MMNRHSTFWLLVLSLFACFTSHAQTNSVRTAPNRFLFVIETSSEMKKSATAMRQSLTELVHTGMGGLMQDGDNIGLWTFNEELFAGKLPMQTWNNTNATDIARNIDNFLKSQKLEKSPKLDKVSGPVLNVVRSSQNLTVILVTSGTRPVAGTPYDREINEYFKTNQKDFQKKKVPFLTMLLAQRGRILRHSVSPAIGDVKIPKALPLPAPVAPPPAAAMPPVETVATNTTAALPRAEHALIITKKGAESVNTNDVDARLEEVATATAEAQKKTELASAPVPKEPTPPSPTPEPVTTPPAPPAATTPPAVVPTETKAEPPPTEPKPVAEKKEEPAPAVVQADPPKPEPAPTIQTPAVVEKQAEPIPAPQPTPPAPAPAIAEKPSEPVQPTVVATSPSTTPEPVVAPLATTTPGQQIAKSEPAHETKADIQPQVAAAPQQSNTKLFLIGGIVLVITAVFLAFFLGRQSAKRSGPSLITDSMARDKH